MYIDGLERGEPEALIKGKNYAVYIYPHDSRKLLADIYIPQDYWGEIKPQSDLLFIVRIDNSINQRPSFPYILDKDKRYLGAIADLGSIMSPTKFKQVEEVQIDTLANLINPEKW